MKQSQPKHESKPTVLFQASGIRYRGVKEWLPIAQELVSRGYGASFIVDQMCPQEWLDRCNQIGARYRMLEEVEAEPSVTSIRTGRDPAVKNLISILKQTAKRYLPLTSWIGSWLYLRRILNTTNSLILEEQPAAIVVHLDSVIGLPTALIKVANEANIPSLVVPLGIAPPKVALEIRRLSPVYFEKLGLGPLRNRLMARIFPHWVHDCYGVPLFCNPVEISLAAWWHGLLPRIPYTMAGGFATKVAVACDRAKDIMLTDGVSGKEIVVVGRPEYDCLFHSLRKDGSSRKGIYDRLGIDLSRKFLLYAVAHFGEHRILTWEEHWRETEYLLTLFAKLKDVQIVISLPPASRFEDYQAIAAKYNAVIARDYAITELVASCDVFVAGSSSTTVTLAIGSEKPAVVVEFYGFKYSSFFEYGGGTVVVRRREDLLPLLERIVTDGGFYRSLADAQRDVAPEWILLDGKCASRIANEIISLIEAGRSSPVRV